MAGLFNKIGRARRIPEKLAQYDSCGEKAQSDALIVPFKNLINDAYCRDISVKIRSQLDIKRKMGDFIGAFAPYGYRKDEANRNRLVVDEEAARTVELIFRLRIQGLCNSAIADRLNSMGVLSPMEYKQAQGFNYSCGFRSNEQAEWSPMLVKRILSNEIYIGTLIQHKSGTPNHKIKKRVEYDRDEWIVIENNHEPIICRSDFDTVQNLMLRDVRTAPKQEKVHLFSGFVFCGDCKHTARDYVRKFNGAYSYITQLVRLHDKDLFNEYQYTMHLARLLPRPNDDDFVDIEDKVKLEYAKLNETFKGAIVLDEKPVVLTPSNNIDPKLPNKRKDTLQSIIDKVNERFSGNFTDSDRVIIEGIYQMFMKDSDVKKFKKYAKDNSTEMFVQSLFPDKFRDIVTQCFLDNNDSFAKLFNDPEFYQKVQDAMAAELYTALRKDKE